MKIMKEHDDGVIRPMPPLEEEPARKSAAGAPAEIVATGRMAFSEYVAINAINWHSLKNIGVSPLLYRWHVDHPEPEKPCFALGAAAHCAVLEPDAFSKRYAECDVVRNPKHEKYQTWLAEHPGVEALLPHEHTRALEVGKAVRKHPLAKELLRGGLSEEVLTWRDAGTGLACKGRLDYLRPDLLLDLKTASDIRPPKFERAAHEYGYAVQTAFYQDGGITERRIDGKRRPWIVAVQSSEPFDVVCFELTEEALAAGRSTYQRYLRLLVSCIEADYWPGIAPEMRPLNIPSWATAEIIEQEAEEF